MFCWDKHSCGALPSRASVALCPQLLLLGDRLDALPLCPPFRRHAQRQQELVDVERRLEAPDGPGRALFQRLHRDAFLERQPHLGQVLLFGSVERGRGRERGDVRVLLQGLQHHLGDHPVPD